MRWWWIGPVLVMLAQPVAALDLRGPRLAAASNFGQGMLEEVLSAALSLGVTDFRDAVYWDRVETRDGRLVYDMPTTVFPDAMAQGGAIMSLTVNNGHPAHEDGQTPLGPSAVAAFGRHAAETAARFSAIDAVQVGNEFNSANFVSGAISEQGLEVRAAAYMALLSSVAEQVQAARPGTRIIGGGVHSIPTGYLSQLAALGAAGRMDSLALHPYDTPVEQLARQIAVMRRDPPWATMPVEITEFGSQRADAAPGVMLRSYCQMALSGVSRAVWYALNRRGDGYVPLIAPDLRVTSAGRSFAFIRSEFEGVAVRDAGPDAFTYACRFGDRKLVIWGAPRGLWVDRERVAVLDAQGRAVPGPAGQNENWQLSETEPLVLIGQGALQAGRDYRLEPQPRVADSYHQFAFPDGAASDTGFARLVRSPAGTAPLVTMPGQDRPGTPWTPYLGRPDNPAVRLLSETMLPGGDAEYPVEILHRFTAPDTLRADLTLRLEPAARSADGVAVTVTLDGHILEARRGKTDLDMKLSGLVIQAGSVLDIAVGPNVTSAGDVTAYRFILSRAE